MDADMVKNEIWDRKELLLSLDDIICEKGIFACLLGGKNRKEFCSSLTVKETILKHHSYVCLSSEGLYQHCSRFH
jgi:hypothetical protein